MKTETVSILFVFYIHYAELLYCYWNTGCPYKYLTTETPYNSVRGDIRDSVVKLKGCQPVSLWGIYRHGKQFPSSLVGGSMKEAVSIRNYVVTSYEKGHSSLCAQDVENLRNWEFNESFFDGKQDITEEGRKEMVGLGKRLKEAFPALLNNLQKGSYTFRSARGPWIEKSIKYFVDGLGNKNLNIEDSKAEFDVMDPYTKCESYQETVQKNPNIFAEADIFLKHSDYLATRDKIQRRSGIDYTLSDKNITALYDLCRYTWSAVDDKASPWCALFTKDDLQVLEYIQDLKHYYSNGYGTPVNKVFGRVPLVDLLQSFEKVKKGEGKKIIAYVTHATMLDQIYIALGLFKDSSPLTGTNMDRERKWRTSKISVFSANLVAVLNRLSVGELLRHRIIDISTKIVYRCEKDGSEDYNVVFYLNEEPIRSICEDGVCSWREFDTKLRPFINTTIDFC